MTELFIYLFKAAVINAIILGFYCFTLKKTNRFSFMRLTLLSAMILPLLLPLIPISGATSKVLTGNTTTLAIELPVAVIQQDYNEWLSAIPPLQEFIYYLIAFMFLIGIIFSIISIFRKKVRSVKYSTKFGDILIEKSVRSPFSFFEWVFFSRRDLEHPHFDMLLKHEFYHVKEKHSLDRIISGIFRSVLWFSPLAHLTAKHLIEVHEYQADANVLQSQVNSSEYSDLVLSFYLNNLTTRGVSNNFSFHIKKRIAMINNFKVGQLKIGRIIFGISFSLLAILATSAVQSDEGLSEDIKSQDIKQSEILKDRIADNPEMILTKPDTIKKSSLKKQNSEQAEKNQAKTVEQEKAQKEQEKAKAQQERIQKEQARIEIEQKKMKAEHAKIEKEQLEKEKEFKEKELEFKEKENEFKDKEKEFNQKEKEYIEKARKAEYEEKQQKNVSEVDKMPQYPGGFDAMVAYLSSNIKYPEEQKKKGIEGTVYVSFIVKDDGTINDVKAIKGIDKKLDEIAVIAVSGMPKWEPGEKDGKKVTSSYTLPIKFALSKEPKK